MLLVFLLKYKLHPEPSSFNFFFSYGMAVFIFHIPTYIITYVMIYYGTKKINVNTQTGKIIVFIIFEACSDRRGLALPP